MEANGAFGDFLDAPGPIGLFGGTFDPPHIGHLWVAAAAREFLSLEVVALLVAPDPWQKTSSHAISPLSDRLAMVRAAVSGHAGLVASGFESGQRGPTYTVDTLDRLAALGVERPYLILGADSAAGIETWHRAEDVARLARIAVFARPGSDLGGIDVPYTLIDAPQIDLSSTTIRGRVATGRTIDVIVPAPVVSMIRQRGLYR